MKRRLNSSARSWRAAACHWFWMRMDSTHLRAGAVKLNRANHHFVFLRHIPAKPRGCLGVRSTIFKRTGRKHAANWHETLVPVCVEGAPHAGMQRFRKSVDQHDGESALAKGGSGDVLSGIVGAALARRESGTIQNPSSLAGKHRHSQNGHTRADSQDDLRVAAAVYLHGLAGDLARDALHENSVLATDVVDTLPQAFRDCDTQAEQGLFYLQK